MTMTTVTGYDGPVIDACVHHSWRDQTELMEYFSAGWREFVGEPGSLPGGAGAIRVVPGPAFRHPTGDKDDSGRAALSDPELMREQLLDRASVNKAVLSFDDGLLAPTITDYHLAREVCRAANDWCTDRWLSGVDKRYHGLVLAPNQVPEEAAAEVRRAGAHPRMVGVVLGGNGVGQSFGHRLYHPIYEAAADLGLPIVLHVGGDAAPDARTSTAPAGNPSSFTEYSIMSTTPLMTHLVSFLLHGVFERFPGLRLMLVGAGAAWLAPLMWRLDSNWRGLRREVPWVRKHPSEYLWEHVRLSTWPLDQAGGPEDLQAALGAFGPMEDLLCFGSGFPDWNWEDSARVAAQVPESWHAKVFQDNAESFFRWPGEAGT
ncbi:hypothetical protein BAY59_27520 [Prauserella coralliicola]|nr:hypothetical protein BAY59_27520 [Prauserella coralliicola]